MSRIREAQHFSAKSLQYFNPGQSNELNALDLMFFAGFYSKQYKKANDMIDQAFRHPVLRGSKFLQAKWQFYRCAILFRQGNFRDAQRQLLSIDEISKDKTGWLIGMKLLEIMLMIELKNTDLLEFKIINLNNSLSRYKTIPIARYRLICKSWIQFLKGDINLALFKNHHQRLKKARDHSKVGWISYSFEPINYTDWFGEKMKHFNFNKLTLKQKVVVS